MGINLKEAEKTMTTKDWSESYNRLFAEDTEIICQLHEKNRRLRLERLLWAGVATGMTLLATRSVIRARRLPKGFMSCKSEEATHVRIRRVEPDLIGMCEVTAGRVYPILSGDQEEEAIRADNDELLCEFSLYLDVEWLKKS